MYYKETYTEKDKNGKILHEEITEKELCKDEPNYIKIYTGMWFDFNRFPLKYRELFLQLAIRMSYCNANNLEHSQVVAVVGSIKKDIMAACGWKTVAPLMTGLRSLCDCGAIKRLERGCYQINPTFAGKGPWRFNPKLEQGGIKDLVATFDFAKGNVCTTITYNDEEQSEE